jgi:TetR/AcrR family transcriptional regulator
MRRARVARGQATEWLTPVGSGVYRSVRGAVRSQRGEAAAAGGAEDVRDGILRAAEAVFAERGYAAASTREIAERAGIGKRMLFYYFESKDAVYEHVLGRLLDQIQHLHALSEGEPGPDGLRDFIAALLRFAAANPDPVRLLVREIIDEGKHLDRVAERYVRPLFASGYAAVARNAEDGVFGPQDPMHALINIGGMTIFYVLTAPLTARVWNRDPLDPEAVEHHIEAAVRFALAGLTTPAAARATAGKPEGAADS